MSDTAAVVGAGTMGIGIAYTFAISGFETTVVEPSASRVEQVRTQLRSIADDGVKRGKLTEESAQAALDRLSYVKDVTEIAEGLDVVVETVPERIDLKVSILKAAEERGAGILASNTSALSVDELASALTKPESFLGMHFFNPVWAIGLIEIIRGAATADETVASAVAIAGRLGKETAVVRDSPGFATSRLDLVTSLEAMRMVQAGVASAEDIDRAMRVAYRHPVGPLKLSDIVGLDIRLDTSRHLSQELGVGFAPPQILIDMVERGDLGEKSGKGFYEW